MGLIDTGRSVYHALRRLPDRARHRSRRRAALARQTAAGRPQRVLILCYGNICRSPYAEARLRRLLDERGWRDTIVESAGFIGPGRPANDTARRLARARGLDLGGHRSRIVGRALAREPSLLLVMTAEQAMAAEREAGALPATLEVLGDLDPDGIAQRDIPDPYGQRTDVFERVFDRIDRCLASLVGAWET
jgi:protein-tyrosine phosphatase